MAAFSTTGRAELSEAAVAPDGRVWFSVVRSAGGNSVAEAGVGDRLS
jgi:hypothetical protein